IGDGNFELNEDSFLWSKKQYLAPQSWTGDPIAGNMTAIVSGKYIKGTNIKETADIQNDQVAPTNTSVPYDNGITSGSTTYTYSYASPTAVTLGHNLWISDRDYVETYSHTGSLNDPAGGQFPPSS